MPTRRCAIARELIIKNNVDFLSGTLTSAEAPAVSTIAKENKVVFVAPTAKTMQLTAPQNLHPYIFRMASNTADRGPHRRRADGEVAGREDRSRRSRPTMPMAATRSAPSSST